MKSVYGVIKSFIGDQIAEWIPGGPFLLLLIHVVRAREFNLWSAFLLAVTLAMSISWYVPLPKPYDAFNVSEPSGQPNVTHVQIIATKAVPVPDDVVVPKPLGEPLQGRRYRVANVDETDSLKVRSGPGVTFEKVGELARNATGIEIEGEPMRNELDLWVPIVAGKLHGWVNTKHLVDEDVRGGTPSALPPSTNGESRTKTITTPDPQLIEKLEFHCVNHFNTHGQWAANYKITAVKQRRVEFYDGKKARIRLGYEFTSPQSGVHGKHERIFSLRWTWGDFWQVETIGNPIKGSF